ncbi:MAG TPA: EAL domain-containing response regulator [Burkholderiaceae bacterium]
MNTNWNEQTALVVEDSGVQRAYLVKILLEVGFGTVLEAENGTQAMQLLEATSMAPIALVLTDLEMPEMDGIELIRRLNGSGALRNLIVVSGRDPRLLDIVERMASDSARFRLLGTLTKPVQTGELLRLLHASQQQLAVSHAHPKAQAISLADIEEGIRQREFVPYFQPKVAVATGELKGVEALARWLRPGTGLIMPDSFIPALEGTEAMEPFTLLMAEETLKSLSHFHQHGMPDLTASINLSAQSLSKRSFITRLLALVDSYRIAPRLVIWEVTETMLMENLNESLGNLAQLGLKGYGLAMDDYGIGYSSIQQFSRCPFTELKIDRSFVRDAASRRNRRVVLENAVELGQRLGVATVAEGVETRGDWDLLRTLGCDLAQGYLIAKPMPAADLVAWRRSTRMQLKSLGAGLGEESR